FTPAQNRRPHRLEIIGGDAHRVHSDLTLAVRRLTAFNVECFPPTGGTQWQMARQARRFDSWNCSGSFNQIVEKRFPLSFRIAEAGKIDRRNEPIPGLKSDVNGLRV